MHSVLNWIEKVWRWKKRVFMKRTKNGLSAKLKVVNVLFIKWSLWTLFKQNVDLLCAHKEATRSGDAKMQRIFNVITFCFLLTFCRKRLACTHTDLLINAVYWWFFLLENIGLLIEKAARLEHQYAQIVMSRSPRNSCLPYLDDDRFYHLRVSDYFNILFQFFFLHFNETHCKLCMHNINKFLHLKFADWHHAHTVGHLRFFNADSSLFGRRISYVIEFKLRRKSDQKTVCFSNKVNKNLKVH